MLKRRRPLRGTVLSINPREGYMYGIVAVLGKHGHPTGEQLKFHDGDSRIIEEKDGRPVFGGHIHVWHHHEYGQMEGTLTLGGGSSGEIVFYRTHEPDGTYTASPWSHADDYDKIVAANRAPFHRSWIKGLWLRLFTPKRPTTA